MSRVLVHNALAVLCLCGLILAADRGVWLDVPFVKQEKNGCGAASIAMVMQYWQRQGHVAAEGGADAAQIQKSLYSARAHGIYASDIEAYFRAHGFKTFAFQGRWTDLQEQLQRGRPLMVALKPGRGPLHYVVAAGVDMGQDVVLKNDPAERRLLKQERSEFESEWKAAGYWTLLALPYDLASSSH
ncbi:MAG TPA: C39 family peptidase [Terriglobales bacterium]|jgi:ABC-type bacteriocin/lantibiotic exporter with double-glycine peptidase domain